MPRVYERKKAEEKFSHRLNIPITPVMDRALTEASEKQGVARTAMARRLIEEGLGA